MKKLIQCLATSTASLGALAAFAAISSACTIATTDVATDAGPNTLPDGALVQPTLPFVPSNIASLAAHDLSAVADATVSADCTIDTDPGTSGSNGCADAPAVEWVETMPRGSQVHVFAYSSFSLNQTATLKFTGSLPAIVIAFHDLTLSGKVIAAPGVTNVPGPGGFSVTPYFTKGGGPGGGPAGVQNGGGPAPGTGATAGISGGGGSFCGLGGPGTDEGDTAGPLTVSAAPATPAYGTSDLVPLVAGSSGGTGGLAAAGSGGGAVQFVAGGAFTLGNLASIDVGGGSGGGSGETNAGQEASGGGSGGAIMIEAMTATISGALAANGGGGGAKSTDGELASTDGSPALGGTDNGAAQGGNGSAAANINGAAGLALADSSAGGGGGGAGRIRINTASGAASVTGVVSPSMTTTCGTQGTVVLTGSDAGSDAAK